jgi:hypothetical protein
VEQSMVGDKDYAVRLARMAPVQHSVFLSLLLLLRSCLCCFQHMLSTVMLACWPTCYPTTLTLANLLLLLLPGCA